MRHGDGRRFGRRRARQQVEYGHLGERRLQRFSGGRPNGTWYDRAEKACGGLDNDLAERAIGFGRRSGSCGILAYSRFAMGGHDGDHAARHAGCHTP